MVMRPPWLSGVMMVLGGVGVCDMLDSEQLLRRSEVREDPRVDCRYTYVIDIRTVTFGQGKKYMEVDSTKTLFPRSWRGGPDPSETALVIRSGL